MSPVKPSTARKHTTHKATPEGRARTLAYRARRNEKRGTIR